MQRLLPPPTVLRRVTSIGCLCLVGLFMYHPGLLDKDVFSQNSSNPWLGCGEFLPLLSVTGSPTAHPCSRDVQFYPFLIHTLRSYHIYHLPSGELRHVSRPLYLGILVILTPKISSNGVGSFKHWSYCLARLMRHREDHEKYRAQ